MTAFATTDDVQARARTTLTADQISRASALLDDVSAEILVFAPATPDGSAVAKAVACRAVLRELNVPDGIQSRTVGSVSTTFVIPSGTAKAVLLTEGDIKTLRAAAGSGAFSIRPYIPPPDCTTQPTQQVTSP